MVDWLRRNLLLVLLVAVPTCAASIYYGLIASDVYVSESRFLLRSPQHPEQSGVLSELLGGGGGGGASRDDTYAVHDYIMSRDALRELEQGLAIRKAFSNKYADVFNRFPGLTDGRSFEEFYRYYGKHIGIDYDSSSSISILTVSAFTAQDANKINSQLLEMSERLVNTLNDRARQDLIRFADDEVKIASDKAKDASLALLSYRSSQSVFAPDQQAALQLAGVAKLQEELVGTEADLAQLAKLSPNNPQIAALESRAETLRKAIASEAAKVTSARGSLSARAPDFERLTLELGFADKQLGIALAELETARTEARQKQLYLVRLVQPSLPDKAMQPRRIRSIFTVFVLGLFGWGVVRLLIASIREHMD
jgi:capsular polysaccharide transport system permease protein